MTGNVKIKRKQGGCFSKVEADLARIKRSTITEFITEKLALKETDVDVRKNTGQEHAQKYRRHLRYYTLVESETSANVAALV